ncbi:thioredoxin family protein [Solidesulfovibrio carbinolicus]|uniref:Thioredoxin n=1 Tax=Solidesulfovibrio carbinolicus TaxID=296842 RepID=A0A4P6HGC8_9BACT|nr:thioredoxin family protein [Solidesulfovibrio carbinolicus]QAZ65805.1 thioredoxin [Solidesulfovibrio carbinolicus]
MRRPLAALLLGLALWPAVPARSGEVPAVPAPGMVTMVDLGAKACVPCKMMQPVLASVEARYAGRAAIIFIDVWENRDEPRKYGLRVIPTQIFYDKTGKEVSRHEGFLDEKPMADILDRLLAE